MNKHIGKSRLDKNLKLFHDFRHSQKEKRFVGLGKTNEGRKLFLVFTLRGEKVRIISACDMSKRVKKESKTD